MMVKLEGSMPLTPKLANGHSSIHLPSSQPTFIRTILNHPPNLLLGLPSDHFLSSTHRTSHFHLNSGEGCLVAPFWLHLVLYGTQMWVAHVHITRANVTCVLEVGRWTNHGPVNPSDMLLHTFPLQRQTDRQTCKLTQLYKSQVS